MNYILNFFFHFRSASLVSQQSSSPNLKPLKTTAIPEISYSSSEDEDFFDAEDDDSDENDDDDDEGVTTTDMRTPPATLDLSSIGGQFLSLIIVRTFL